MEIEMDNKKNIKKISIGMPIYNGESFIHKSIGSLLDQTFTDFELIISDNASNDGTEKICREYASKDNRIRYIRQPENMGAADNFVFVLKEANCEYFMWAAHDDFWEPTFIEKNYKVLVRDSSVVLSISKVSIVGMEHIKPKNIGTFSIYGDKNSRINKYLSSPAFNSRFYGLCRKDSLKKTLIKESFFASDWAIMVNLLQYGNSHEVDKVLMFRSGTGSSATYDNLLQIYNISGIKQFFPFIDFTIYVKNKYGILFLIRNFFVILKWQIMLFKIAVENYFERRKKK